MIPSYLKLYQSGELDERAKNSHELLGSCSVCPRQCKADRLSGKTGFCKVGEEILIASVCDHHGEEPVISGSRGSGTVFFGSCNLQCVFCQNHQISQPNDFTGLEAVTPEVLAERMVRLQNQKHVHNINLVSPSHWVPQIIETLRVACGLGLNIPLVYNSNGFDGPESLALLDGLVDIYLPDFKYADDKFSDEFSSVPRYSRVAQQAIREMWRQVGAPQIGADGVIERGLIIRHLILPNNISGSMDCLKQIRDAIGTDVWLSLMSQYYPTWKSVSISTLSRKITAAEYHAVVKAFDELGFTEGFIQPLEENAADFYQPDFSERHPFEH
jgi:putative pyruvate formate lyase activating enzyme